MAETEHITVATTSAGVGGSGEPGRSVDLPVVELLTGRGFVTGKSGSGKSNTASVIAEKLLDNGFGLLVVDIDGEYYGLKEEYEILHVGADEECDIQVTVEHAEKIASLALEQNVPIILDISSFLDEEEAEELLTQVAKQLFAKAKKQKQPFLMLVEECHEWIPEKGSVGEVGKMLIKIGKRGRKHGLGMVGISQRPADVKKDYITQCDWLVWHRLTWNNDTKVVSRIIDKEYADAVEDLDDGEAFMMTDWSERIRRVQFHRKQTFDAGATPGLDDFERPELKSVSEDLVSELTEISEEKEQTESRITELREELDKKNSRIAELERELQDARDLSRMAEQFTEALLEHVEGYNPGKTEQERMRERRARFNGDGQSNATAPSAPDRTSGGGFGDAFSAFAADTPAISGGVAGTVLSGEAGASGVVTNGADADDGADSEESAGAVGDDESDGETADANKSTEGDADAEATATAGDGTAADGGGAELLLEAPEIESDEDPAEDGGTADSEVTVQEAVADGATDDDVAAAAASAGDSGSTEPRFLRDLRADVSEMDEKTQRMLAFYVEQGPETPLNAHFSAGGSGNRTSAYAHNRELRLAGLVEHVGRGKYDDAIEKRVAEAAPADLDAERCEELADRLREDLRD